MNKTVLKFKIKYMLLGGITLLEQELYKKDMQTPYYQVRGKIDMQTWKKLLDYINQKVKDPGSINKGEYNNIVSKNVVAPINNYFRELKYDLSNGVVPGGKYGIPAAILGGASVGTLFDVPIAVTAATTAGATIADVTANKVSKILSGRDLGDNVSKYTGLDSEPAHLIADLPVATIGAKWGSNSLRRGIETAMRTTHKGNPIGPITRGISSMIRGNSGGKKRLFNISKYILTGKLTGRKGYYNSFAEKRGGNYYSDYTGFEYYHTPELGPIHNDVIDAYLYRKDIDPYFGLKKVAQGKDFGVHTNYIHDYYPGKAKNIRVYETNQPYFTDMERVLGPITTTNVRGSQGPLTTLGKSDLFSYDAEGHLREFGKTLDGLKVYRGLDIWKFEPRAYHKKYLTNKEDSKTFNLTLHIKDLAIKEGLKTVDYYGNPIIVRTLWGKNMYE